MCITLITMVIKEYK